MLNNANILDNVMLLNNVGYLSLTEMYLLILDCEETTNCTMIEYEIADSSFFSANKEFCKHIEVSLAAISAAISGNCNCYGYELESVFVRNSLNFTLHYTKYQTTQNGVVVAVDANEYAGVNMFIKGINPTFKLKIGRCSILRLFCRQEIKNWIPKPYFIWTKDVRNYEFIETWMSVVLSHKISSIRLKNGKLSLAINGQPNDPVKLIEDIDFIIKKCLR